MVSERSRQLGKGPYCLAPSKYSFSFARMKRTQSTEKGDRGVSPQAMSRKAGLFIGQPQAINSRLCPLISRSVYRPASQTRQPIHQSIDLVVGCTCRLVIRRALYGSSHFSRFRPEQGDQTRSVRFCTLLTLPDWACDV